MIEENLHPLTLESIEQAIINKAQERNAELHKEFYSYEAGKYEFVDINNFSNFKLLLFRCPKSKSTVSIKIERDS